MLLKLLFARIGEVRCCNRIKKVDSAQAKYRRRDMLFVSNRGDGEMSRIDFYPDDFGIVLFTTIAVASKICG